MTIPRKRFRTIGARLTLWGAATTLSACTLLSVALYVGLLVSLRHEIDTFLEGEVHEFMVTVNAYPNDMAGLQRSIRRELGSRTQHDLAFRLFDERDALVVSSVRDDVLASLWKSPPNWLRQKPHWHFATVQPSHGRHRFRTCSLRIRTNAGVTGTAQADYTLDHMEASLVMFRRVCAVGLAIAAILSIVSGRLLARRSLRPVQTVTQTANHIGSRSLSERIPLTGTGDEFDQLANTLNHMLERIERHVQRVRQFTADASHELRSPLAALRGTAEVALSQPRTTDELRRVLEESIEHYDRLARIAEDLLLLARADAGHDLVRNEWVRLDQAVENVVDLYTPLAQERGIDLVLREHDAIEVNADGARLRQLIGNLIDNAVKFTPDHGRIDVSLSNGKAGAAITIADTGPGIPHAQLPHVFDRFYRADRARSSKRPGAGLGLPICRVIAEAHGGSIDIQNRPEGGTVVTIVLPRTPPADESQPGPV